MFKVVPFLLLSEIKCRYIIFLSIGVIFIAPVKKKKKKLLVRINCQYNIIYGHDIFNLFEK